MTFATLQRVLIVAAFALLGLTGYRTIEKQWAPVPSVAPPGDRR